MKNLKYRGFWSFFLLIGLILGPTHGFAVKVTVFNMDCEGSNNNPNMKGQVELKMGGEGPQSYCLHPDTILVGTKQTITIEIADKSDCAYWVGKGGMCTGNRLTDLLKTQYIACSKDPQALFPEAFCNCLCRSVNVGPQGRSG